MSEITNENTTQSASERSASSDTSSSATNTQTAASETAAADSSTSATDSATEVVATMDDMLRDSVQRVPVPSRITLGDTGYILEFPPGSDTFEGTFFFNKKNYLMADFNLLNQDPDLPVIIIIPYEPNDPHNPNFIPPKSEETAPLTSSSEVEYPPPLEQVVEYSDTVTTTSDTLSVPSSQLFSGCQDDQTSDESTSVGSTLGSITDSAPSTQSTVSDLSTCASNALSEVEYQQTEVAAPAVPPMITASAEAGGASAQSVTDNFDVVFPPVVDTAPGPTPAKTDMPEPAPAEELDQQPESDHALQNLPTEPIAAISADSPLDPVLKATDPEKSISDSVLSDDAITPIGQTPQPIMVYATDAGVVVCFPPGSSGAFLFRKKIYYIPKNDFDINSIDNSINSIVYVFIPYQEGEQPIKSNLGDKNSMDTTEKVKMDSGDNLIKDDLVGPTTPSMPSYTRPETSADLQKDNLEISTTGGLSGVGQTTTTPDSAQTAPEQTQSPATVDPVPVDPGPTGGTAQNDSQPSVLDTYFRDINDIRSTVILHADVVVNDYYGKLFDAVIATNFNPEVVDQVISSLSDIMADADRKMSAVRTLCGELDIKLANFGNIEGHESRLEDYDMFIQNFRQFTTYWGSVAYETYDSFKKNYFVNAGDGSTPLFDSVEQCKAGLLTRAIPEDLKDYFSNMYENINASVTSSIEAYSSCVDAHNTNVSLYNDCVTVAFERFLDSNEDGSRSTDQISPIQNHQQHRLRVDSLGRYDQWSIYWYEKKQPITQEMIDSAEKTVVESLHVFADASEKNKNMKSLWASALLEMDERLKTHYYVLWISDMVSELDTRVDKLASFTFDILKSFESRRPVVGPVGQAGPQGETGSQGPKGDTGPIGPTGTFVFDYTKLGLVFGSGTVVGAIVSALLQFLI